VLLPVSGAHSKGIFSVHQSRSEIAHEYKGAQQSQPDCDGLPGDEDDHDATSVEEGQLATLINLIAESVEATAKSTGFSEQRNCYRVTR
jgi:hypothetical protein